MSDALEDLHQVLELLERWDLPIAEVEFLPRWHWREEPFGPCPRCWWPAHCLGPDGRPWHAFCWGNNTVPSSFEMWLLGKAMEEEAARP
jgi:hypothetical protein